MGKVILLILATLGAQVNADLLIIEDGDSLADILADRASAPLDLSAELDQATLGKKAQKGAKPVAQAPAPSPNAPKGKFFPIAGAKPTGPRRVFGGTNKLMAGAGMPAQATGPAVPSYWGGKATEKGMGYGWSLGSKKLKAAAAKTDLQSQKVQRAGKFNFFGGPARGPKKVFGGTNKLMAGQGMPIQQKTFVPSYWGGKDEGAGVGYGWNLGLKKGKGKTRAKAETPVAPPLAPRMGVPLAPRVGVTGPQMSMRAR